MISLSTIKGTQRILICAFLFLLLQIKVSFGQKPGLNKLPYSGLQFNDDTGRLQFAIVSDLWGGNRPGVFEDAVAKIELLQPQFVMSVGDLIDGKTHTDSIIGRQWNDFAGKIKALSMPFFYVPGNHDIGNADMEREWVKKLGRPYYYFVYKNVLFLCVNTQDGGVSGIRQEQINFFKKVIAENRNVRWTFLFMHRPVWFTNSADEEGFEKIEDALKGRKYTLFSGHYHTYLAQAKNGNKHFILGSTGGGSDLRGEKFGEFDHITLVTLNSDNPPKIANLKLSGIIKEDVVNDKTYPITSTLIDENWISAPTYVSSHQFEKTVRPEMIFVNPTPYPLEVTGDLKMAGGYSIHPEKIKLTIPPGDSTRQALEISSTKDSLIDLSSLSFIDVPLDGLYRYDTTTYQLPTTKKIKLEWKNILHISPNAKKQFSDQFKKDDSSGMIAITRPELENKWYWYGANDCLIKFKLISDNQYLYILCFVKDDQVVIANKERDILYLDFEDKYGVPARFSLFPDYMKSIIQVNGKSELDIKDMVVKTEVNRNGFLKFMIQLPIKDVIKPDRSIRFNIGYRDQDSFPDVENATLFWKPQWGTVDDYKNSGSFILEK